MAVVADTMPLQAALPRPEESSMIIRSPIGSRPQSALSLRSRTSEASLIILPEGQLVLKDDHNVQRMEQFASGICQFLQSYEHAVEFIGPHKTKKLTKPRSLQAPPPEIADVVTKYNLGDLGESLFLLSKDVGRDFCMTFTEYQKLCQGDYYCRLDSLFELAEEPVELAEFAAILPINEITKAVNNLSKSSVTWPYLADLYQVNIHEVQSKNGALEGDTKHLEQAEQMLSLALDNVEKCHFGKAECYGQLEQALADEAAMNAVRASQGDLKNYYEHQLSQVSQKKAAAEKQEHDYTYKMYGLFKYVYENDVKLAKEKVQRYAAEEVALRQKIAEVTTSNNESLLKACDKKTKEAALAATKKMAVWDDKIERANAEVVRFEKEIENTLTRIAVVLQQEGHSNVGNFLEAMDAMKAAGEGASTSSSGGTTQVKGWIKDLNFVAVLLNRMARSKTLQDQLKAYKVIKAFTAKPNNKLCQVLTYAAPILSLGNSRETPHKASRDRKFAAVSGIDAAVAALPERGDLSLEDIEEPEEPDETELEREADNMTGSLADTFAELLVEVPDGPEGVAVSDQVFVDDLADEFED